MARLLSEHRKLSKAIDDIECYLNFEKSDRIYSKLSLQHLTGRLTLTDPPLQMVQNPFEVNVNKKPVVIKVRNLFRVKDTSRTLISVDYSQPGVGIFCLAFRAGLKLDGFCGKKLKIKYLA